MLLQSAVFQTSPPSTDDFFVLSNGLRRILVPVPATYIDLVTLAKESLGYDTDALAFETDDLNICRGSAVEIHKSSWEAVRSVVGLITVVNLEESKAKRARQSRSSTLANASPFGQDVKPLSTSIRMNTSSRVLVEKRIEHGGMQENIMPSSLEGDIETQVEDELFNDDIEGEEEEEEDEQPFRSPAKGKGRALNRILSEDEDEDEVVASTSSHGLKNSSRRTPRSVSPHASATRARATPRDANDMFSPVRTKQVETHRKHAAWKDSSDDEENDENIPPPRSKPFLQRRATPVTFEEEELAESNENAVLSPLRRSIARSEARINVSANPEVRSVKKTPHKSTTYAALDEVSPSPKPKFNPRSPQPVKNAHVPVQSSALRLSALHFDADEAALRQVEPLAPLRATAPLPNEKILITIGHPQSGQESKFKIKGKHVVERVLASACAAFALDLDSARLFLQEEIDGIETTSECKRNASMIDAGVRNESYLIVEVDEEAEDLE